MTTLAQLEAHPAPANLSQMTQVEQSRAIAEVQAAVVVAQQCPRDIDRAVAGMRKACSLRGLAERAFYAVPNRGSGPTVHLARELARLWGNVQYGVHELRRDDQAGLSEIQAFAWDVETNTRSTRTFVVPHERMVKQGRRKITDLGEIYLNNQNIGARAVRECIFTVLPTWLTDEAEDLCRKTLTTSDSNGPHLADRIATMVATFDAIGVTTAQLEARTGKRSDAWDEQSVAGLGIDYRSIQRGDATTGDLFPKTPVTADELLAGEATR